MKKYVSKIQELEGEVLRLQNSNSTKCSEFADCLELNGGDGITDFDTKIADISGKLLKVLYELRH